MRSPADQKSPTRGAFGVSQTMDQPGQKKILRQAIEVIAHHRDSQNIKARLEAYHDGKLWLVRKCINRCSLGLSIIILPRHAEYTHMTRANRYGQLNDDRLDTLVSACSCF